MKQSSNSGSISLEDYAASVKETDRLPANDLRPVLLGLFGEVGSVMAPAKKIHREGPAYTEYASVASEEFGDTLWYLTALAHRTGNSLADLFSVASNGHEYTRVVVASDWPNGPVAHVSSARDLGEIEDALLELGTKASNLSSLRDRAGSSQPLLVDFVRSYLRAIQAAGLSFAEIVCRNREKTTSRFTPPNHAFLPTFDSTFGEEERLPDSFEVRITQRASGQSYLQWRGVFIGDPLTDNILDKDGYRFHDVFHLAHAAVLGWSPVFRALIKHKRKSDKVIDEAQDGGRAIVIEEGLTAWLFSRAKRLDFFSGKNSVAFDILKTIQEFTRGYEVEACPLSLWESAILQGYDVFRKVHESGGGLVIGDRRLRTIRFEPETK